MTVTADIDLAVWRTRIKDHNSKVRTAHERVTGIIDELRDSGVFVKQVDVSIPFGHGINIEPTELKFTVEESE